MNSLLEPDAFLAFAQRKDVKVFAVNVKKNNLYECDYAIISGGTQPRIHSVLAGVAGRENSQEGCGESLSQGHQNNPASNNAVSPGISKARSGKASENKPVCSSMAISSDLDSSRAVDRCSNTNHHSQAETQMGTNQSGGIGILQGEVPNGTISSKLGHELSPVLEPKTMAEAGKADRLEDRIQPAMREVENIPSDLSEALERLFVLCRKKRQEYAIRKRTQ